RARSPKGGHTRGTSNCMICRSRSHRCACTAAVAARCRARAHSTGSTPRSSAPWWRHRPISGRSTSTTTECTAASVPLSEAGRLYLRLVRPAFQGGPVDLLLILDIRCAVGMEGRDGLHSPGLALRPFSLAPFDHGPIRVEDEPSAGVGEFEAIAAGLPRIEEEGLIDRVLVGAVLDEDAVLEEDVGGLENVLASIRREGQVVEAAAFLGPVIGINDVVGLLLEAVPPGTVASVIEGDAF